MTKYRPGSYGDPSDYPPGSYSEAMARADREYIAAASEANERLTTILSKTWRGRLVLRLIRALAWRPW